MKTLREYIQEAERNKTAIGHFNVANLEMLWGVFQATRDLSASGGNASIPIIIGASEGERDFMGIEQIAGLVRGLREQYNFPIFLNADHSYSFERVKEAVDAGFDMAIFDGAKLSFEENIKITKQCVKYARSSKNSSILIEGELGYIGEGSNLKEKLPEGAGIKTKPEEAGRFVGETEIDLLAPSVGNIHGIIHDGNPHIDAGLVKEIRKSAGVPLVLHGGSGITDVDFTKAIEAGISIIHISTELRLAYQKALKFSLQEAPEELAPYKILKPAMLAVQKTAESRLKLFNRAG